MPWFKIDDGFHNHPKILAVGNAATGMFVRFGSYCSQQLTDGFVPEVVAKTYGKPSELRALVDVELVVKVDGGYLIPDFLDYNPSADETRGRRHKEAERKAEWRAVKAGRVPGVVPTGQSRHRDANATRMSRSSRPDPTRPIRKEAVHIVTRDDATPVDNSVTWGAA